jgi:hypothetical protein
MKRVLSALLLALALVPLGAGPSVAGNGLLGLGGGGRNQVDVRGRGGARNHLDVGLRGRARNHVDLGLRGGRMGFRSRLETVDGRHRHVRHSDHPRFYYSHGYSPYFYSPYAYSRYHYYHPYFYGPYGYSPYYYGPYYGAFYDSSYVVYPAPPIEETRVYVQQSSGEQELEPGYWYYCRSAGAYYPKVERCAEEWIKVPPKAQP